jgi:hypothetical protein
VNEGSFKQMKEISMNTLIRLKKTTPLLLAAFAAATLACFGLSPAALAVTTDPQGYFTNANTAEGAGALETLVPGPGQGHQNTALGDTALTFDETGSFNTATGGSALDQNVTGNYNTANGYLALLSNDDGSYNTAVGALALEGSSHGNFNTAIGRQALNNVLGSSNIAVGADSGINLTSGDNNIDIGNAGFAAEANTIRIGTDGTQTATYIAGINGFDNSNGSPVFIDENGQLGTGTALQGPAGPQGPQGDPGPQGPAGAVGPQGPAGPTGATGPAGAVGPIGPQGPAGPTGAIGPAGPVGPTGAQGLQGLPGSQGSPGPIGATGPQGPAGEGLVSGAYLQLAVGTPPPAGFTMVGTTTISYRDTNNRNTSVTVNLFRKN